MQKAAWRERARITPVLCGFPREWGGAGFEPGFLMPDYQHHARNAKGEHGHY
ncbi:hypothetical protein [Streptomyces sioyaensis]|uniref:hypothetical protein n=1 Tax=Streptomyces sioyaensis TaxID=67364 RepID=UPI0037AE2233